MEKGQSSGRYSRVCILASSALFFWVCMMCLNFVMFDGNQVVVDVTHKSEEHHPIDLESKDFVHYRFDSEIGEKEIDNVDNTGSKSSSNVDKPKPDQEMKKSYPFMRALRTVENKSDPCGGRYVYVYDLPSMFNEDMIKNCASLNPWENMCKYVMSGALGPSLGDGRRVFSKTGWYDTNQFALDVIFANRMKQYECLTNDSSIAAAIFVPFYAGLDIARYLWGNHSVSARDAAALALVDWLRKKPEWGIMGGRDHFFVGGRITWDFRRVTDKNGDWGSKLLLLPAVKNISMLVIESSPWSSNDYAIPYPTYFHPAKDGDVINWQRRMRKQRRRHQFCFAGAPRPGNAQSIRGMIIDQCKNSKACSLLGCEPLSGTSKCHSPTNIMKMFQTSIFCLQPPGDSFTRRSTFDAILAGCIPVFFHPGSAYTQYTWHLPKDYSKYSVFIPENDIRKNISIEQRLRRIPTEKVKKMRDVVISLIPKVIYADPHAKLETVKDAFDVTIEAVIEKVTKLRKDIIEGRKENRVEALAWKYAVLGGGGQVWRPHEWDPFFSKTKEDRKG